MKQKVNVEQIRCFTASNASLVNVCLCPRDDLLKFVKFHQKRIFVT